MYRCAITKGLPLMVKNHSKKNDARNLIAQTGQNLTSALADVSIETGKYVFPSSMNNFKNSLGNSPTPAGMFLSDMIDLYGTNFVSIEDYEDARINGIENFDGKSVTVAECIVEERYYTPKMSLSDIPPVPTASQMIELYGSWDEANIAVGMKSFNGWHIDYTFTDAVGPDYRLTASGENSWSGVNEWPNWVDQNSGWLSGKVEEFPDFLDLLSKKAVKEALSGSAKEAATEYALLLADMADAILEGKTPNKAVLDSWLAGCPDTFRPANGLPSDKQLIVLSQARKYL